MADSGSPLPRKNGYRKNDYIVYYPDLIKPHFPHSHCSPIGKCAMREFGIVVGIFLKRTIGTERNSEIFQDKSHWKCNQFFEESNKCGLLRKLVCKFSNHIYMYYKNQ